MRGIWWPLHSVALFLSGIILAERPTWYPAFSFFFMGWTLLAVQYWRNNSLDPWKKSKPFLGLCTSLTTGIAVDGPASNIPAHHMEEESKAEEKLQKDRVEKAKKDAEERQKAQVCMIVGVLDLLRCNDSQFCGWELTVDSISLQYR